MRLVLSLALSSLIARFVPLIAREASALECRLYSLMVKVIATGERDAGNTPREVTYGHTRVSKRGQIFFWAKTRF